MLAFEMPATMDLSWMTKTEQEKAVRWKLLGELGVQGALRECGVSEEIIQSLVSKLETAKNRGWTGHVDEAMGSNMESRMGNSMWHEWSVARNLSEVAKHLGIPDGRSLFLAVIGRGDSVVQSLAFNQGNPYPRWIEFSRLALLGADVNVSVDNLSEDEVLALCVNLASNKHICSIAFPGVTEIGTPRGCRLLANALASNDTLRYLDMSYTKMNSEAVNFLLEMLRFNEVLSSLYLWDCRLNHEDMNHLAKALKANTTLENLALMRTHCDNKGAKLLSSSLKENTGLTRFTFSTKDHCDPVNFLAPFIHDELHGPKNTTLTDLGLFDRMTHIPARDVSSVIRTNRTLTRLRLCGLLFSPLEWLDEIVPSLAENRNLIDILLDYCEGLDGDTLFNAFMEVALSNTNLEDIYLYGTGLELRAGRINEELRVNRTYRRELRDQPVVKPKFGRLVLCGYEFSGKTSICRTLLQMERGNRSPYAYRRIVRWKKFWQGNPRLRQFVYGSAAVLELQSRTRGFDICVLNKDVDNNSTSVWDFAGQREYYVLHDYLFPNKGNSCFLYVCSARRPPNLRNHGRRELKNEKSMREEFRLWLQFITSNSKPVQEKPGERRLPHVTFVLTNKDTLSAREQSRLSKQARNILVDFQKEFRDVVSFADAVEVIDALSCEHVSLMFQKLEHSLAEMLDQSEEYAVCEAVRRELQWWTEQNPLSPIMALDVFTEGWIKRAFDSPVEYETVLVYLNDIGEIMYFKGLKCIVVNPGLFGVGVLGSLIDAFGGTRTLGLPSAPWRLNGVCGPLQRSEAEKEAVEHVDGYVRRSEIEDLLKRSLQIASLDQTLSSDQLIDLLLHLEMCFRVEESPEVAGPQFFIPALLDGPDDQDPEKGLQKLKWDLKSTRIDGQPVHFMGRRLECENKSLTILTPGFFPRLQVVLRNFLEKRKWTQNFGFRVAKNLVHFIANGMEVFVEYSGDMDYLVEYSGDMNYFVDVLVKSSKTCEETLRFLQDVILKKILEFCASPQGCQGVQLLEAVIRPVCVKEPYSCLHRRPHAVSVSVLEGALNEYGSSYKHTWREPIKYESHDDFALDLLQGEGSFKAANQEVHDQSGGSSSSAAGLAPDWSRNELPKGFLPTIDSVSFFEKLDARANIGGKLIPIKIHFMCDGIHAPHEVDGQPGRTMKLKANSDDVNIPILQYAVKLFWAGVKVSASTINLSLSELTEIDTYVNEMSSAPTADISVNMLHRMISIDHSSERSQVPAASRKRVPTADILRHLEGLEEYVKLYPSAQWLTNFVNLRDQRKFSDDFQLTRMRNTVTNEIVWLCSDCYRWGIKNNFKSVPL